MGLVLAANGLGGAVAAKILTPIIYEVGNPFGYRKAYFLIAAILLAVAPTGIGLWLAPVYAVLVSCALPLETILLPLIAADLFGQHSFAKIMGFFVSVNTAGYALGAPIANLIYDLAGSYAAVLIVAAVIMLVSMPLFQKTMTAAEKERH